MVAPPFLPVEVLDGGIGWVRHGWMVPVHPRASDAGEQDLPSRHSNSNDRPRGVSHRSSWAFGSGRCQVRSGYDKSGRAWIDIPRPPRATERAGERWFEPHGSVRLDIVDMMDMVVSLVWCVCVWMIGKHIGSLY